LSTNLSCLEAPMGGWIVFFLGFVFLLVPIGQVVLLFFPK
jgi:hypothetical protein